MSAHDAPGRLSEAVAFEAVWVPVLSERRIAVLGSGIIGPSPNFQDWEEGLAGADTWKEDTRNAHEQHTTDPE